MQLRMEERISLCEVFRVLYTFCSSYNTTAEVRAVHVFQVKIHSLFNTENSNCSFRLKFRLQLFKML